MCCCAQLVGLKMNPGRSIVTFAVRNRSGMPSMICGNGSLVTVNAEVSGFDVDPRAHHDIAQVERPRDRRHDDRQAKRRTL